MAAINAFTERPCSARPRSAPSTSMRGAADAAPLAGVPFAVKNLFDVEGLPTLAGSKINRDRPPGRDGRSLVRGCEAAGAVLVGALNMDEYAYGFTTENTHYGPTRNPHDLDAHDGRIVGRLRVPRWRPALVPIVTRLGHQRLDPRAVLLCGVFGLKPT